MCGIVGFIAKRDNVSVDTIINMRDALYHRGPDDEGIYIDKKHNLALGHRRLSILDLSEDGKQPFSDEDGTVIITYNGEVYNYREIRKELEDLGYRFVSGTDTEVILHSYKEWGIDALHKFIGMFAFAIWDKRSEELILARDRVGVKPLYYYYKNNLFMFASELRSFIEHPEFSKEVDRKAVSLYFQKGYIPAPYSIFMSAKKLEPGHYLVYKKGNISKKQYWNVRDYYIKGFEKNVLNNSPAIDEKETAAELEKILVDSFKLRLVSDVPVGLFLSGGVDSSMVTALLQAGLGRKLKTFTIGFNTEGRFNEAPVAKQIAQICGTDHTEYYFGSDEVKKIVSEIPLLYDEPFGDSSALPTYLVSTIAKKDVKVVLSADGADELFCGYNLYNSRNIGLKEQVVDVAGYMRFEKIIKNEFMEDFLYRSLPPGNNWNGRINKLGELLEIKKQNKNFDLRSSLMCLDFLTYLPDDIMVKVDRATMGVSIEGREPFLDHRLIEYASMLPLSLKFKNGVTKYILKSILAKYIPETIINKPKQGFSIPLDSKEYRKILGELFNSYISSSIVSRHGILDLKVVECLKKDWKNGRSSYEKLWHLLCFQVWCEKYL